MTSCAQYVLIVCRNERHPQAGAKLNDHSAANDPSPCLAICTRKRSRAQRRAPSRKPGAPGAMPGTMVFSTSGSRRTIGPELGWCYCDEHQSSVREPQLRANVAAWTDQVSQVQATQGSTARQPTLRSNALNGKPVVRFDGDDDFLSFTYPLTGKHKMSVVTISRTWALQPASPNDVCGTQIGKELNCSGTDQTFLT